MNLDISEMSVLKLNILYISYIFSTDCKTKLKIFDPYAYMCVDY